MDKLKDFIDKNSAAFDANDPLPEGHLERFEKRLGKKGNIRSLSLLAVAMAVAAGLCLFLITQKGAREDPFPNDSLFICEAEEIEELRLYYHMQIYDIEAQIKDLYADGRIPGSIELMEETERVIQITYDFETDILPTLPCSEQGMFAINQHYGNSLGSLNFMLEKMKQICQ
jgi:hypothetical protein